MRLIIEARLEGSETGTFASETRVVAVIDRQDHSVADLGLTLAEGRALLTEVQAGLVAPNGGLDRGASPLAPVAAQCSRTRTAEPSSCARCSGRSRSPARGGGRADVVPSAASHAVRTVP